MLELKLRKHEFKNNAIETNSSDLSTEQSTSTGNSDSAAAIPDQPSTAFQNTIGNLPHIHMMVEMPLNDMTQEKKDKIAPLLIMTISVVKVLVHHLLKNTLPLTKNKNLR
mgnify:CR=1 FL=1